MTFECAHQTESLYVGAADASFCQYLLQFPEFFRFCSDFYIQLLMFNFLLGGIPPEGEKVNARDFCDEQFYRSPHLQNHVKVEHPPPEAQRLPVQGQQFKPQEVPPKCQYCNKTLPAENFHQIQLKLTFRGQIVCIPCQLAFPNFPDLPIMLNPNKAVSKSKRNLSNHIATFHEKDTRCEFHQHFTCIFFSKKVLCTAFL